MLTYSLYYALLGLGVYLGILNPESTKAVESKYKYVFRFLFTILLWPRIIYVRLRRFRSKIEVIYLKNFTYQYKTYTGFCEILSKEAFGYIGFSYNIYVLKHLNSCDIIEAPIGHVEYIGYVDKETINILY